VDFTADTTGPHAGLQAAFGGTLALIVQKSATQITVTVPKLNAGVYQVVVTNFDGQFAVSPGAFTVPGPRGPAVSTGAGPRAAGAATRCSGRLEPGAFFTASGPPPSRRPPRPRPGS
jgi:hypothetical protein